MYVKINIKFEHLLFLFVFCFVLSSHEFCNTAIECNVKFDLCVNLHNHLIL